MKKTVIYLGILALAGTPLIMASCGSHNETETTSGYVDTATMPNGTKVITEEEQTVIEPTDKTTVGRELDTAMAEIEEKGHNAKKDVKAAAEHAKEEVKDAAHSAKQGVESAAKDVKSAVKKGAHEVDQKAKEVKEDLSK